MQQNWAMISLLYLKEFTWIKIPHVTGPPLLPHLQQFGTSALLAFFSSPKMLWALQCKAWIFLFLE